METLLRSGSDGLFDGDSRIAGVDWRLGFNPTANRQMLGFMPHRSNHIFTRVVISSGVCGDSLPECSWGARKSVIHIPQCVKKKNVHVSEIEDCGMVSMKEWSENKPAGFGKENVYDTSLEDKILEEIKRDRVAQAAALLTRGRKAEGKIEPKKRKEKAEFECQPGYVEVRVDNLPKKKNIERDLQLACKNVPGLIHINPSVLGNEKTRDPICKGFGSLFFGNITSAQRFVSSFEDESVKFGNIHRKLSYKILTESGSMSHVPSPLRRKKFTNVPQLKVRDKTAVLNVSLESIPPLSTSLQPESISPRVFDTESPEDGKTLSSAGTWNGDHDGVVDIELSKKRKELNNALIIHADTIQTKTIGDIDCGDACDVKNGESQQDSCTNTVFPRQEVHLHHMSTDSGDSLNEDTADFSREDQSKSLIANSTSPQENSVSTLRVAEVRKREPQKGPLSEDEKRIEALEKRLLSKMKGAEFESKDKESKNKDSRQQRKKRRGFNSLKSKPSELTLERSLGSASRLKKKERKFITDALLKYGRQESMANS